MGVPMIGDDDDDDFQNPVDAILASQKLILASCKASKKKPRRSKRDLSSKRLKLSQGNCDRFQLVEPEFRISGSENRRFEEDGFENFVPGTQLNALIELCIESDEKGSSFDDVKPINSSMEKGEMAEGSGVPVVDDRMRESEETASELEVEEKTKCPVCADDITELSDDMRFAHSNECLEEETPEVINHKTDGDADCNCHAVDVNPVLDWLQSLGLSRYGEAFIREEIDWASLQWLTEEDLLSLGIIALGPRRKIVNSLNNIRKKDVSALEVEKRSSHFNEEKKVSFSGNKLITEFFRASSNAHIKQESGSRASDVRGQRKPTLLAPKNQNERTNTNSGYKRRKKTNKVVLAKMKSAPQWCCIPGTPFRVDAFRYLSPDCSDWFLTHFHTDHYQGLTRGFCRGKIYCSSITARLVNMKIGVPWNRLELLPLNQKIDIKGIGVTCLDANHCPGSIVILFEPPNGKPVLHTGDFRFCEDMASNSIFQSCRIHTLILDTTYCNTQYDFPRQDAVIQFVIDVIQAEAFNPKALFLIGTYTIGKEKLFLEAARILRKKIYVGAAKLRLLECLELPEEDLQWFTSNELESNIHVVPMWMLASFKRMKYISNQYSDTYTLIVAFSPTGWTFGKGKKKSTGRRSQQGTIIRYEVPYSEHCSFSELRQFVKFVSPEKIIPSVNNDGQESEDAMVELLNDS